MIEALIIVAMIGVLTLTMGPFVGASLTRKDAQIFSLEAVDALREAQSSVMSGRDNARWGVHFEGASFALFKGAVYNAADPENVVHALSGQVSVTAVTLSPGGACTLPAGAGNCDVHFASRRGVPTETGSVVFTAADGTVRTVTLNAQGMIDVN